MHDHIKFKGVSYPVRHLDLPEFGEVTVGTTDLEDRLFPNGEYVSREAENIDSIIFCYVSNKEIQLETSQLKTLVSNHAA